MPPRTENGFESKRHFTLRETVDSFVEQQEMHGTAQWSVAHFETELPRFYVLQETDIYASKIWVMLAAACISIVRWQIRLIRRVSGAIESAMVNVRRETNSNDAT